MISDDSYDRKIWCFAFRAGSLPQVVEEEEREERIPPSLTRIVPRSRSHRPQHRLPYEQHPLSSTYLPILQPLFLILFFSKQLATDRIIHSYIQQSSVLKKKIILCVVRLLPAKLSNTLSLVSYPFCPKQFSYGLHLSSIWISSIYIICCQCLWLVSEKKNSSFWPTICVWLKYIPCFSSILSTEFSSRSHCSSIHHSCIHIPVKNCVWLVSKQKKLLCT